MRTFGQEFASRMRRPLPRAGGKRDLDEVVMKAAAVTHRLRRAVDEIGMALDVIVQSPRGKHAAKRLLLKLLRRQRGRHAPWSPTRCQAPSAQGSEQPAGKPAPATETTGAAIANLFHLRCDRVKVIDHPHAEARALEA